MNFTPNGRTAATKDRQEYEVDRTMGKIETMVMFVLLVIKRKKDEQMKRVRDSIVSTRTSTGINMFNKNEMMNEFCLTIS